MVEDLEQLKQRIPLLEYLQRHNWKPCRAGSHQEWVGLCPLLWSKNSIVLKPHDELPVYRPSSIDVT